MFKTPFSFEGRIRRLEYGLSLIIFMAGAFLVIYASELVEEWALVGMAPLIWFRFAQGCKRCHDRGNSGAWQLIPYYGLWLLFADSEFGVNEYGHNPKGIGNYKDVNEFGQHLEY